MTCDKSGCVFKGSQRLRFVFRFPLPANLQLRRSSLFWVPRMKISGTNTWPHFCVCLETPWAQDMGTASEQTCRPLAKTWLWRHAQPEQNAECPAAIDSNSCFVRCVCASGVLSNQLKRFLAYLSETCLLISSPHLHCHPNSSPACLPNIQLLGHEYNRNAARDDGINNAWDGAR